MLFLFAPDPVTWPDAVPPDASDVWMMVWFDPAVTVGEPCAARALTTSEPSASVVMLTEGLALEPVAVLPLVPTAPEPLEPVVFTLE